MSLADTLSPEQIEYLRALERVEAAFDALSFEDENDLNCRGFAVIQMDVKYITSKGRAALGEAKKS